MSNAPKLKPCPFCGGDAITTPSVVDRLVMYAHCKDHTCPGWTVSRTNAAYWNLRATQPEVIDLAGALKHLLHAVCSDTGFAACVREDSGKAYPWAPMDIAEEKARAALAAWEAANE